MTNVSDFIIAGAPKCGSFLLYETLKNHSRVNMSIRKEPGIYAENWKDREVTNFWLKEDDRLKGEATVGYFIDYEVPRRIHNINPSTKLIFCLRNPVDRTFSHYWHGVKNGYERRSWQESMNSNNKRKEYLFQFSFYYENLLKFFDYFPVNQIHFFMLERYKENKKKEIGRVLNYLNLEQDKLELDSQYVNQGKSFKNRNLHFQLEKIRKNHRSIPGFIRKPGRYLYDLVIKFNTGKVKTDSLSDNDRQTLNKLYQEDVSNLKTMVKDIDQFWNDFE